MLTQLISLLFDLFTLLRQPLRILQRRYPSTPRLSRWEQLGLAVLAAQCTALGRAAKTQLHQGLLLFQPDTVLRWHREVVRRKWTLDSQPISDRPSTSLDRPVLVLRLAQENPSWGDSKLHSEVLKLGYSIGRSTVRDIRKRPIIAPVPQCTKNGSSWHTLLSH